VRAKRIEQPATSYYRVNGLNTINLVFVADAQQNSLRTADAVHRQVALLNPTLPAGYTLSVSEDTTEFLRKELYQNAWMALASLGILVVFVWLTSWSRVYLLIIGTGLVANLALSVILFYAFRTEIHLYSLAALTTSLGIVIDNSIVMIDHYRRYQNRQVFLALLGATLANLAGLSVIYFLPERIRLDLIDFASVLIITLLVSLMVALWLVPALMIRLNFTKEPSAHRPKRKLYLRKLIRINGLYLRLLSLLIRYRKTSLLVAFLAFGLPVFMLPDSLESKNKWADYYNQTLGHEWYKEQLRPYVNKYLGGTLRLFSQFVFENSYYTQPQETILYVNAALPNGYTIEQMNELCKQVEQHLGTYAEIARFVTQVYSGQAASITVYFKPSAIQMSFPYVLKSRLIALSLNLGGAEWDIYGVGQGFSNTAGENPPSYLITMYGYNYEELERQAIVFQKKLLEHPRIQEVDINRTAGWFRKRPLYEYLLQTDPYQLALSQVSKSYLYRFWQQTNRQPQADLGFVIDDQYTAIKLIPSALDKVDVWYLKHYPIPLDSIGWTKGLSVSQIRQQQALAEVRRENQQYIRVIGYEYMGSAKFGDRFLDKTMSQMKQEMPLGYSLKRQDAFWWNTEDTPKQYGLIALTIVLIYFICVVIFESLKQPMAIIGLIPLSFIGVFISFYWFDFNFDQGGYASFLLLAGNVVNAGIFIVNEFNIQQQKHPNRTLLRNYLTAFHHKILPILLTVLSTVVGFVPFLWAGSTQAFWFALAVGSVAGLLMSLLVIFIYLPVFLIPNKTKPQL
jgi:multidrug efflux pump subunit AcrB